MRAHQGVARHDANDGERNRRHDDQRREVAAKLRHHQQVNQDQADRVGSTHVAECVIGNLQLAIPLDGVLAVRVSGLVNPVFAQITRAGQGRVFEFAANGKEAVQRRVQLARHVTKHIAHALQVFGKQGLVDGAAHHLHQFRQGHHLAVGCAKGQGQQGVHAHLRSLWQLQAYRYRVFGLAIVQVSHIGARECHGRTLRNDRHRNAQRLGPLTAHAQVGTRGVFFERGVDAYDVWRVGKCFRHACGQGLAPGFIGAVDLGHQRRHHRRAGRHFHHFDAGLVFLANFFQRWAQALGNGVALLAAVFFVHQVHLQVALLGLGPEVILAHQPIEGDGRGRACVGLQVENFGLLGQKSAQLVERGGGVFQRRACGHFHHHLKLTLVVKRQHLQDHPLHQHQAHRER